VIVLDASVWVSALRPQDTSHQVSDHWLTRWTGEGNLIVVPTIFLAEVGGAIARRTGDPELSHQAVQDILSDPMIQVFLIDHALAELAAQLAVNLSLRGADATYVAVASHLNVPLVTWDQEQLIRSSTHIAVQSPTD
jgi:predicted nucleic acid-binding protein